ncbi:MAG: carbohydrate ABC transporter permease [Eubacteriales bacterium]
MLKMKNKQPKEVATDFFSIDKKERALMKIVLIILTLIWCVPVYSLIQNSLKVNGFENYTYVLTNKINGVPFYIYFKNSGINAIGSSSLVVFVGSCSGYAFSKIKFTGRRVIYSFVLMCMAISGPILLVPFFFILKNLGIYNTHLGIILCEATITIPFSVLMMKNFFDGLPEELMESASIDGANIVQTFSKVYLPLAKPALINLGVLQFMWSLQDFLFPLMYLTKEELYTTTVAVNSFQGAYGMTPQDLGRYNAALVLIAIPSIVIFMIAQKYIINGVTSGAVKE